VIPLTELEREVLGFMAAEEHGQGRFTVRDGVAYLVGSGLEVPIDRLDNLVARLFIRLLSARFIRDAEPGRPSQVLTMQISDRGREALAPKPKGS
jgi:hypothetical protein